ncbi:MAG TPA: protein kinase, partial [Kofleriaceae bacterium]|nr:protein kinase [Kofleriaceae bacterium]
DASLAALVDGLLAADDQESLADTTLGAVVHRAMDDLADAQDAGALPLRLGPYRIVRRIGEGGMGAVFEVFDQELDEPVALKLLHAELSIDPDYRQRLRQEVRLARRVSHPNVCRVHDLGQHGDQLFVTMELLRGATLRDLMRSIEVGEREPLSLGRKVDLVVQLCAALTAAHRAGIVHRDVKPDNIIVEEDRSVLTDFGVSSPVEVTGGRSLVVGTPHYIAPEILRGEVAGPPSDLYACGLVAYELLAGRAPFTTATMRDAMERARATLSLPPLPEALAPAVARVALERVLARALDPQPGARPDGAARLAEAIALAARGELGPDDETAPVAFSPDAAAAVAADAGSQVVQQTVVVEGQTDQSLSRVATALVVVYRSRAGQIEAELADDYSALETRPIELTEGGELEALERVVTELGGTVVDSRPGDMVALFGVPRAHGDDAVRATRAGHALAARAPHGRVGLHTGRVTLGSRAGEPRASGEAVKRARELIGFAEDGQVLASDVTSRHLVGRYPLFKVPTSGGAHMVPPQELANADRFELAPLFGREVEVGRVERLVLQACEERAPRSALVVGPPGAGKSRLRLEVERQISSRREVDWLIAGATPLGEAVPFGLLRRAAPSWFDAAEEAAPRGRAASFAAARQWIEARAAIRPVVICFDDVHWADGASLDLLADLRRTLRNLPVAILLFARAEPESPDLPVALDLSMELAPLRDGAARDIARRLAPEASEQRLDELVRRAGGNPFFVEELARGIAEAGKEQDSLPAAIELVIQARIDRLPRPGRRLAHAASVVGREFDRATMRAALDAMGGLGEDVLNRALSELERRQIIVPVVTAIGHAAPHATPPPGGDERYMFHHALIRDVVYAQLDEETRRRAHAAVAAWIEQSGASGRGEPQALSALAVHRDAAGDRAGARAAYLSAGQVALRRAAFTEAMMALTRAEQLTDAADPRLIELLGDALVHLDSAEASRRFRDALELSNDCVARARLHHKLGEAASHRSDTGAATAWFEAGLALLGDDAKLDKADRHVRAVAARLYGSLGWVIGYEIGDHGRGLPCCERAVQLLEGDGDLAELGQALSRLAANYLRAGRWRDRLRCNQRFLVIARALADVDRQMTAHINLGDTFYSLGDLESALSHTRDGLALAIRSGRVSSRALAQSNLGLIMADTGAPGPARRELEQAIELAARVGYTRFLPETFATLARLALRLGDLDTAEAHAAESARLSAEAGSPHNQAVAWRLLAAVLARRGGRDADVDELLRRSLDTLGGDPYERGRTLAVEAKILALRGLDDAAAGLRDEAAAVFESLGAELDLGRLADPLDVR